jgi:hypothetical protein
VTEDQAKRTACPFAPMAHPQNPWSGFCIGSACMAWRWAPADGKHTVTFTDDGGVTVAPASETSGYCGLAGTP